MSLNNYNNLKASISTWLARKDLDAQIPDFITLAEARLNNNAEFRVMPMVCKLVASVSGTEIGLPDDYLGMRILRHTSGKELTQVSPERLGDYKQCTGDLPRVYCNLGRRLEIWPGASDTSMELFYYQKIPALSDTNLNNWLLAQSPDTYLYGSLLAATQYMKNDERVQMWGQMYADSVGGITSADQRDRWSGLMQVAIA